MKEQTKEEYIGEYLDKKMKGHNLPYGLEYLNLVAKHEEKAERNWENMITRILKKQ